jgi:uncharacterized protein
MTWKFEWDPEKANRNFARHGVTFEQGARAFVDKFAVEWIDDREDYGEERINPLGMCDGVLLHTTYTEREDVTRIISVRRAKGHEREHYFGENAI